MPRHEAWSIPKTSGPSMSWRSQTHKMTRTMVKHFREERRLIAEVVAKATQAGMVGSNGPRPILVALRRGYGSVKIR